MKKAYILGIALILICLGVAVYEGFLVINGINPVFNLILMCWNCIPAGITMGVLRMFRTFANRPATENYTITFDDGHKEQFNNYTDAIERFNDELAKMIKDTYKETCEAIIKELDESEEITYRTEMEDIR